jgi:chemotaxis protein methyltransferase CheR
MIENHTALKFFASFIEAELGIVYLEANYFQLEHRLKDIATQLGFANIDELHQKARMGIEGQMKSLLLDLATNNETSFFRDPAIFKALGELILPTLMADPSKRPIRIWSAASSSGQEAYSIAMELHEFKQREPNFTSYSMLVSDISDTILKRARAGKYSQLEVQRGLPARLLVQHFEKEDNDVWHVKPHLQEGMEFKRLNLLSDWGYIGPFDVVFVRNVLIYQAVENKKKVIAQIYEKLNPNGFLVMGAAESLFGVSDQFRQLSHGTAIVYQKI